MVEPKPTRRRWQFCNFSDLYCFGSTNNRCHKQL